MSSVVEHYRRQYPWRPWPEILELLGDLRGETVLDLGCGVGDQAADLARRGADVVGIDGTPELVEAARARQVPRARFLCADVRSPSLDELRAHGAWMGFSAAYFPALDGLLERLERWLLPAGWLAVTEVDDLLGHEPLAAGMRALVEAYYERSLAEGLYAFRSRAPLCAALERRGWSIEVERELPDRELAFRGPAEPEVLEAWRARLAAMLPRFVARSGPQAAELGPALLAALAAPEHRSTACVWFLLARAPERPGSPGPAGAPRAGGPPGPLTGRLG